MSTAVNYFWSWFVEYQVKFKIFRSLPVKEQNHYSFWLKWHLHFYAPGLDYILKYPQNELDKIQLIITSHGDSQYFLKVEEVVDAAPKLKNWDIIAFIEPYYDLKVLEKGLDKPYVFDDLSIKISELNCIPILDPVLQKVHLVIYLDNYVLHSQNENLLQLILLMLQDLLGEKSFYKNIDLVQLKNTSTIQEKCLIPLFKLQQYIDEKSF